MMSERPNILFIHTDQQRFDTLGCYGNNTINTSNIDNLAKGGTLFENAHCTHPLCMPSRGTLLTGRYPSAHGLWRNGMSLPKEEDTIASLLKEHGYATGLFGKAHFTPHNGNLDKHPESIHLGNVKEDECWEYWRNFNPPYYGFDQVEMTIAHSDHGIHGGHYGLWLHENHRDKIELFYQESAIETTNPKLSSWKSAVPKDIHSTTWVANRTIDYIKDEEREDPFFAWVGFPDPHFPLDPPDPYCYKYNPEQLPSPRDPNGTVWPDELPNYVEYYLKRGDWSDISKKERQEAIANYYGMIDMVDDYVGKILAALKEENIADNTIVVFTSDHGEWLGDHGLWFKGSIHTRGITQIPWIIRWPEMNNPKKKVETVTSQIDLVPTLLDMVGIDIPYGIQGKSLYSVIKEEQESTRPYALIEHRHEKYREDSQFVKNNFISDQPEDVMSSHNFLNWGNKDIRIKTIVTDKYRYSYVTGISQNYSELFDLTKDPNEKKNLWNSNSKLRDKARKELLQAVIESEDPLPERKHRNSGWEPPAFGAVSE